MNSYKHVTDLSTCQKLNFTFSAIKCCSKTSQLDVVYVWDSRTPRRVQRVKREMSVKSVLIFREPGQPWKEKAQKRKSLLLVTTSMLTSNGRRCIFEQLKYLHLHYLWVLYVQLEIQLALINYSVFFVLPWQLCSFVEGGLNPLAHEMYSTGDCLNAKMGHEK